MINEAQFITLVARKLAGQATAAELQELDELLQADEQLRDRFFLLQQYFSASAAHSAVDTETALERTLSKLNIGERKEIRSSRRTWWYAAAALVAGLAVTTFFMWPERNTIHVTAAAVPKDTAQWLARQNGKATRAVIELGDGSKVWLNADTKMVYPPVFSNNSREVYLSGEAFFNVATDAERPFIVHLAQGTVKVLGTSFNIRAYENEPVQTSVTTGKVAFIPKQGINGQLPDTVFITPDEKVIYRHTLGDVVKETTSGEDDRAWTEGRLVFKDAALEDICLELERTFGKKVLFESEQPRSYRLTGSFKDNNLQEIMYYLSKSKSFKYSITDSALLISE